jgi:hypothetical protein
MFGRMMIFSCLFRFFADTPLVHPLDRMNSHELKKTTATETR